jgi:hypothetical protein
MSLQCYKYYHPSDYCYVYLYAVADEKPYLFYHPSVGKWKVGYTPHWSLYNNTYLPQKVSRLEVLLICGSVPTEIVYSQCVRIENMKNGNIKC